ncbi:adenylosuccinate synthase [Candidatus Micrarchaeota archaeon]|nr:adenylosuccinate synthase [Candidatus Micrarchaeota archaeon]MBU1165545.1 adenylosuccinate synthase [Candidatus Micrarchaeota archaeon]MBU1886512.1 adenylosuccinate synthase [Candidatus Micrarchaeota archaeon]
MTVSLILGLQWGDEGKGKIVDLIAKDYDYIVRFNGGNNAGHTIVNGKEEFKLHLVPSGVFYPEKIKVIANGVVIDPGALIKELDEIEARGYSMENLIISSNAHLILQWHKIMDGALDDSGKIGTTKKGIGPAYSDKASRTFALRACDLLLPEVDLTKKIEELATYKKPLFEAFDFPVFNVSDIVEETLACAKRLKPHIQDTQFILNNAISKNKKIMLEGANGALLDIDHGTFPYVTSSSVSAGGACTGTGIPPTKLGNIIGIVKAYTTRVGSGPFPTELNDADGEKLREVGHEVGTTTGRPRRCGWLDLVLLKYTCMINGATEIALTKIDVLDGFDEIKICTSYEIGGKKVSDFPLQPEKLEKAKPVYEKLPGWKSDISNCKKFEDLPPNAKNYIKHIEKFVGVPIKLVSVGPKRDETIIL